jgi:ribonuclease R
LIPQREKFIAFLTRGAQSPLDARALIVHFEVSAKDESTFMAFLDERVTQGDAVLIKGERYAHPGRVGLVVGRLSMHPDGFGFVIPDKEVGGSGKGEEVEDLHVGGRHITDAMHGDRVVARVEQRGTRTSGRVIRVLTRANERLVGTVRVRKRSALVVPLNERISQHILVDRDELAGAVEGQVVEVEITRYPTADTPPEGLVTHVLGFPGDEDVESDAIALKNGVALKFAPETLAAAEKMPKKVSAADRRGREDLRKLGLVTIDGETAKDFDDAVHVEATKDGYRLTVAIADVSHYVKTGGAIDDEARARGTSTYFPDRVYPMLPESLSNHLCSLVPGQERLAMVAELEFSRGGRRTSERFFPAVIESKHRLTYTDVAAILDDPDCDEAHTLKDSAAGLFSMWELAQRIRARRKERGSIDFDLPSAQIILDLRGRPEDIVRSERNNAHLLIEEFMIAANEAVAEHLEGQKLRAPFRIHAPPDAEKVEEFRRFIHNFGYTLKGIRRVVPGDFQDLVKQAAGKPEARMINHMLLRSMKKAIYSPDNDGHFGLASEHYLHFTSPIRRYPDLMVHRILKQLASKRGATKAYRERLEAELQQECPRLSERERASETAERESISRMKCRFMADKVGSVHWGFVTGVASFGIFVELEQYFVDGLVHVSSMRDDFYHYSEELQALIGERSRRRHRIGDRVSVVVDRVDVERRQVDFVFEAEEAAPPKDQSQKTSPSKKSQQKGQTPSKESPKKQYPPKDEKSRRRRGRGKPRK